MFSIFWRSYTFASDYVPFQSFRHRLSFLDRTENTSTGDKMSCGFVRPICHPSLASWWERKKWYDMYRRDFHIACLNAILRTISFLQKMWILVWTVSKGMKIRWVKQFLCIGKTFNFHSFGVRLHFFGVRFILKNLESN